MHARTYIHTAAVRGPRLDVAQIRDGNDHVAVGIEVSPRASEHHGLKRGRDGR